MKTKLNRALTNTPLERLILHTICLFLISWGDCVCRMFKEEHLDFTAQIIIVHLHHLTARHLLAPEAALYGLRDTPESGISLKS